jgi:putative ABC transport system ATP-binding protein
VNNPAVIFADEPTGNLDSKSGNTVMHILQKLNEMKNIIISTGGGIIENKNINLLFDSHLIIYIKRNISNEIKLERCLSKSYDELYKEREPIYEKLSKRIV